MVRVILDSNKEVIVRQSMKTHVFLNLWDWLAIMRTKEQHTNLKSIQNTVTKSLSKILGF